MKAPAGPHIVIVDDEPAMRNGLKECLGEENYRITTCADAAEAQNTLTQQSIDLVITDLVMPGRDGMELLEWIRHHHPRVPVIMITGFSTVASAVEAMRNGAVDYIPKPFELDEVRITVRKTLHAAELERENKTLRRQLDTLRPRVKLIGESKVMKDLLKQLDQIAASDLPTLIIGETGTGKELLAREIHARSARANRPFLSVNCAALPETLLESELFGHTRGAFTGAAKDRDGLFQAADGGTLLLDEIGDISQTAQAQLLRVLQSGEVKRLGENTPTFVDVRVIAATNQPLEELIEAKRFREDLYFRLNVLNINVPPLRERRDDIPLLAEHILDSCRQGRGLTRLTIDPELMKRLVAYDWPGNVRELENTIRRGAVLCQERSLTVDLLPEHIRRSASATGDAARTLEDAECRHIIDILREVRGNITYAARILEISRPTLRSKIEKYGIDRQEWRSESI